MALSKCPECGGSLSTSVNTCIHCGCKVKTCPECGCLQFDRVAFCSACGHGFYAQKKVAVKKPEQKTVEEVKRAVEKTSVNYSDMNAAKLVKTFKKERPQIFPVIFNVFGVIALISGILGFGFPVIHVIFMMWTGGISTYTYALFTSNIMFAICEYALRLLSGLFAAYAWFALAKVCRSRSLRSWSKKRGIHLEHVIVKEIDRGALSSVKAVSSMVDACYYSSGVFAMLNEIVLMVSLYIFCVLEILGFSALFLNFILDIIPNLIGMFMTNRINAVVFNIYFDIGFCIATLVVSVILAIIFSIISSIFGAKKDRWIEKNVYEYPIPVQMTDTSENE